MRDAGRYIFRCAYDAHREITRIFDFVQPTIVALWNLRWQVQGFLAQVPDATSSDLANRFALGSGMRGGELKRACAETPWDRQKADFAEFILVTLIAAFEEYTARMAELAAPTSRQRAVSKRLQYPLNAGQSAFSALIVPSAALGGVFTLGILANKRCVPQALNNLLICYRFFKEMRNMLAHNGGIADQQCLKSYAAFQTVATTSALGLPEVPRHHAVTLNDPIKLELRGVIGLSDVILRIISTYDAELAASALAEHEVLRRLSPVQKKDQLIKAAHRDKRILRMVHNSGLPAANVTAQFVGFLKHNGIIPKFW
jgi:hypothetical protein